MPPNVIVLIVKYSSIPYLLPSRPKPLCLTPPNLLYERKKVSIYSVKTYAEFIFGIAVRTGEPVVCECGETSSAVT